MVDENYNPSEIEPKWQKRWKEDGLYHSDIDHSRPKFYALTMLPYPSGDLHIGHWYAMTPADARARFKRMQGFNVMFPMGFDAFGLPAENAAIRHRIHPKMWSKQNIDDMRAQMKTMGTMFDWRREIITSDPEYYHWTQWFFIQLFNNDLAYRKFSLVDWCPNCNTTLAREQVWGEDRHCERCETPVIKKDLEQWFFRNTKYVEELLDFSTIDWQNRTKTLQNNWIGKSKGASVTFNTEVGDKIEVFTTRPDTLWGATFMVLAPEHPLVDRLTTEDRAEEVKEYRIKAIQKTEIQRESIDREKSGVFTGGYAINPVNNERIPVWTADYILMTYGTGAIMAVPAHDQRDFEFALQYGLPILPVIQNPIEESKSYVLRESMDEGFIESLGKLDLSILSDDKGWKISIPSNHLDEYKKTIKTYLKEGWWVEITGYRWVFIFNDECIVWDSIESGADILDKCKKLETSISESRTLMEMLWKNDFYQDILYHDQYGTMINSGEFTSTPAELAFDSVNQWLEENGIGKESVNYRLRDWLISRQRYWGSPIPIIYCPDHGIVTVPEDQLPVLLPDDVEWLPTGESPLKLHPTWKYTKCPICGCDSVRETDTMDTFMCSSWYHLRYLNPHYEFGPIDPSEYDYWMPVDTYTGGIEHATMHLIYTRFFHKALRDMGITEGHEPMLQLRNQGIILGEDSEKMSKSRGNVVAPDKLVDQYGADTIRAYLAFFSRWELGGPWNSQGIEGVVRWLRRVWKSMLIEPDNMVGDKNADIELHRKVHQTLKQVTHDFENFEFNTIISSLMELHNSILKSISVGLVGKEVWEETRTIYLLMCAPITPHIAEELWMRIGKPYSIHQQKWPEIDENALVIEEIKLVVQVNGKVRDRIQVPASWKAEDIKEKALSTDGAAKYISGKKVKKIIYVPGRLVNIVV